MNLRPPSIALLILGCTLRLPAAQPAAPAPEAPKTPADVAWTVYRSLDANEANYPDYGVPGLGAAWFGYYYTAKVALAERFFTEFPDDPRHWQAQLEFSLKVEDAASHATPAQQAKGRELHAQLKTGTTVPADVQSRVWAHDIYPELMASLSRDKGKFDLARARSLIDELTAKFPQTEWLGFMEETYYTVLAKEDPPAAQAQLKKMLASPNTKVMSAATAIARIDSARTRPLEIKFTALDGREVDLAKLRGKVVLVDFWATWCGPCKAEIPNVVAAYKKYHDRGFEVVGISLDSDKDRQKLTDFVRDHQMPWPQYFDGKGWENALAAEFSIHGIPATWLLDQNGLMVAEDLRGDDLDQKVGRLLANLPSK